MSVPETVTTRDGLAKALSVHLRTIAGWIKEGMPGKLKCPKCKHGFYVPKICLNWCADNDKDTATGERRRSGKESPEPSTANVARNRLNEIKVEISTIELEEKRGRLISYPMVEDFCSRVIGYTRSTLEQLATRIEPKLPSDIDDEVRIAIRDTVTTQVAITLEAVAELLELDPNAE